MRRLAMAAIHIDFLIELVVLTAGSVALDRGAIRHPIRTLRSAARLVRSPFVSADALKQLLQYHRRGFHPNDRDSSELVVTWRDELFGDGRTISVVDKPAARRGSATGWPPGASQG